MTDQYRLRLGDGTVLGVDHDALREWVLDKKAVVQAPGSHRWRSVKQVLSEPRPLAVPAASHPRVTAGVPEAEVRVPAALATPEAPASPPVVLMTLADSTELSASNAAPTTTWRPYDDVPIVPFKPLDDDPEPPRDLPELELPPDGEATSGEHVPPPAIPPVLDAAARRVAATIDALIPMVQRGMDRAPSPGTMVAATWRNRRVRAAGAGVLATGLVAAVGAGAALTNATWIPFLFGTSGSTTKAVTPLPPVMSPVPPPPALPKEVEEAVARLPHLSSDTVQLVLARSEVDVSDLSSLFRRAHEAAHRGAASLTEEEAQELRTLKAAAVSGLGRRERQRVRAYDRMSPARHLLVGEDAKVMALFTRGVRALSPPRQERLQGLLGKAVAADFERRRVQAAEARAR